MAKKVQKTMPFEEPLIQLRKKIGELREYTENAEVDLSAEISSLESRLEKLETDIYEDMKPWDRVQVRAIQTVRRRWIIFLFYSRISSNCMATGSTAMMKPLSAASPCSTDSL